MGHPTLYMWEMWDVTPVTHTRTHTRTVESSAVFSLSWIRNNDFVKTLIGNYSEKLARNNDGWKKDNARAQQTMEANNHLLILVQIPAWDISVRIQKGDKYKYKNWQMQIQKLTYTRTKNEKFCRISFFHANLGLYNGLHVCTCYTAQQVYPEDKFNFF